MYIKSIVLDGFKSYGHRTEINGFDEEFNAITGLNGSGKSNVLDSICFVLGITNLSQVRAGTLQDLIYKSGQAGVTKATVSITFDNKNPDQCPPGFEDFEEITITRQVAMGGKNKYMINGSIVQNKRVQDLFCSVQLNVNNPHFLIMQGKITKVLNMKPPEILAMIEEAAGTKMYEVKRQFTQKTLDKKNAKLEELTALINEELAPRLEKFRQERAQFFEFQRLERELGIMTTLLQAYHYYAAQKNASKSSQALEDGQVKVQSIRDTIESNNKLIDNIQQEADAMLQNTTSNNNDKLKEIENNLRQKEKIGAKAAADEKGAKEVVTNEEKKLKELQKNFKDDEATIKQKEVELSELQNLFQQMQENDTKNAEDLAKSQRKYEALCSGMEVNDNGEAQTLKEQLTCVNQEAAQANTEFKQATIQLEHFRTTLKEKEKDMGNTSDYQEDEIKLKQLEKEIASLQKTLSKINYSDEHMKQLQHRRNVLTAEIRQLREKVENFEASRPFTQFRYTDPAPNFKKEYVSGVVCKLIKLKNPITGTAVETAAGGKLYNVVVNTDVTSKQLLEKGRLQQRTTFIPLNKIQAGKMDDNIIKFAQNLVTKENVDPALALISYEKYLQPAMEYIFGYVFICKDMNTARQVTFHDKIRRRCVTLEGDVTDPSGTLSGGARLKTAPILLQLEEIQNYEHELTVKEEELSRIENEIRSMSAAQQQWTNITRNLNLQEHELGIIRRRLQHSSRHQQQEEINRLKESIVELTAKVKSCKETENNCKKKIKELESRMTDGKSHEKLLKEAKIEMEKLKQKADKSGKEWKQHEADQKTLTLEITELKNGLDYIKEQLKICADNIVKFKQDYENSQLHAKQIKDATVLLEKELKLEKAAIADKNKEIQKKMQQKEKLISENSELELEIKRQQHDINKLKEDFKISKFKVKELESRCKNDERSLKDAENLSETEAANLDKKIRSAKEKKNKLGRTINPKAQSMYEQEEKLYNELQKRISQVKKDSKKLLLTIADLDKKKREVINLAYNQITKDFGSIFGTLLPGANAELKIPDGQTILDGLQIKVNFGGEWKESLSELSGGQRSLAALSLILAMLLFKPAPLYILDEVDAALDLSHTQNIGQMLKTHFKQSQFIIVSLKDGMFNNANVLFMTMFIDGMSAIQRKVNKKR